MKRLAIILAVSVILGCLALVASVAAENAAPSPAAESDSQQTKRPAEIRPDIAGGESKQPLQMPIEATGATDPERAEMKSQKNEPGDGSQSPGTAKREAVSQAWTDWMNRHQAWFIVIATVCLAVMAIVQAYVMWRQKKVQDSQLDLLAGQLGTQEGQLAVQKGQLKVIKLQTRHYRQQTEIMMQQFVPKIHTVVHRSRNVGTYVDEELSTILVYKDRDSTMLSIVPSIYTSLNISVMTPTGRLRSVAMPLLGLEITSPSVVEKSAKVDGERQLICSVAIRDSLKWLEQVADELAWEISETGAYRSITIILHVDVFVYYEDAFGIKRCYYASITLRDADMYEPIVVQPNVSKDLEEEVSSRLGQVKIVHADGEAPKKILAMLKEKVR